MSKATAAAAIVGLLSTHNPGDAQSRNQIAFQSYVDEQWEIFSMNVDGSGERNLTNGSSHDLNPAWSPDGSKIAFASDRSGNFQIYVMDPDGSNLVQLTRTPGQHMWPAWSPDGTHLAYASNEEGDFNIFTMQADGGSQINLTQSKGEDFSPAWSRDGAQIAFSSTRDRVDQFPGLTLSLRLFPWGDIFVMDASGGQARNLTIALGAARNYDPSWSPTENTLAYAYLRSESSPWDIMMMDPLSGRRASVGGGFFRNLETPSWSPDGTWFAYSASPPAYEENYQYSQIYLISSSGRGKVRLTFSAYVKRHPTWSPMSEPPVAGTNVGRATWGQVKEESKGVEASIESTD